MVGQLGAALVRPHAEAEEAQAQFVADRLGLGEMAARLGAGLVEMDALRAGKLELPRRLEADRAVRAGQRDDIVPLRHRRPAKFGHRHQQVANAAGLGIRGRAMIVAAIDEFLMLGADPPGGFRLLAFGERGEEIVTAFDPRVHP